MRIKWGNPFKVHRPCLCAGVKQNEHDDDDDGSSGSGDGLHIGVLLCTEVNSFPPRSVC